MSKEKVYRIDLTHKAWATTFLMTYRGEGLDYYLYKAYPDLSIEWSEIKENEQD